jgi:shikimate dehydrogenase
MISGKTKIYGIFGHPVTHTFSPGMHNAAFASLGMDACYVPFDIKPENLETACKAILPLGLCGLNITVPHKERIVTYLDDLSAEARLILAVNTIEVKDGRLIGHNTDGRGFLRSLKKDAGFNPKGKKFLFVGSGGAARAVGFSLALAGAKKIVFYDLDAVKADTLASDIRNRVGVEAFSIVADSLASTMSDADCLINATPLGLKKTDILPIGKEHIQKKHLVCDFIYNPSETALLKVAKAKEARRLSGFGMLLYQGAIAFETWTAQKAPVPIMKRALARQMK